MDSLSKLKDYIKSLEDRVSQFEKNAAAATHARPSSSAPPSTNETRKRVVIKVGTASLVDQRTGIKLGLVAQILEAVAMLRRANHSVLMVTSGAVGTGAHELGIYERPTTISRKQALAAVGQIRLIRELNGMLSTLGCESAQVLLTYGNLGERSQSLNARLTIEELFSLGVVPIVNENDTVATEEIRFGDNDRLSAMVASLIDADLLFLLTDVDGLYTANPNVDKNAKRIELVESIEAVRLVVQTKSGPGSEFSTGGMESKLQAAQIATQSGVRTVVMKASQVANILDYVRSSKKDSMPGGTVFVEVANPIKGRKRWIYSLPPRGKLLLDAGASRAMRKKNSLFAAGVVEVEGKFGVLDPVQLCSLEDPNVVLAVGLSNLDSTALRAVKGKKSDEVKRYVNDDGFDALIDRENLAWSFDLSDDAAPQ